MGAASSKSNISAAQANASTNNSENSNFSIRNTNTASSTVILTKQEPVATLTQTKKGTSADTIRTNTTTNNNSIVTSSDAHAMELADIVAGSVESTRVHKDISNKNAAELSAAELKQLNKFLKSNRRHQYADVLLGGTVYLLSGLQHFHGQHISALNIVTMWVSGTAFWVNYAKRQLVAERLTNTEHTKLNNTSSQKLEPLMPKNVEHKISAITNDNDNVIENGNVNSTSNSNSASNNNGYISEFLVRQNISSYPLFMESTLTPKSVFQYECTASWLWFMSAFQTFHQIKLIKYTGYNAWFSFLAVTYYSVRQLRCWLS